MYLYIDKQNLISIIKQNKHPLQSDVLKTMKRQLSLFFNFSKKSIRGDDVIMHLFQLLTEGAGESNNLTFLDEYIFPNRPITKETINTFNPNKLSAIYLIDDEHLDELKAHGAVLVGGVGEEMEVFGKLFLQNRDYDFHKEIKIGCPEFRKWTDLSRFNLPLTDIVFVDRFILADISLIDANLIEYLRVLCEHARNRVNIVLYIDRAQVTISYGALISQIKNTIQQMIGIPPFVTIVEYSEQAGQETLGEHDRTVFTNYIRVKSGDTYNYFLSNGNVRTKGREISYNSLAKRDSHELAKTLIADLQRNIDYLKLNNTGIHGDRRSNYLNFT